MRQNVKAIVADIDHTLTIKGGCLPSLNKSAFETLHQQGVLIGLATGREIKERLKQQGKDWGLSFEFDFIVGMNGGMVYDKNRNRFESMEVLSYDEMMEIMGFLYPLVEQYQISVNAEGGDNFHAMHIGLDLIASAKRKGITYIDTTGDVKAFCSNPAYKILFRLHPKYQEELFRVFKTNLSAKYQMIETYPGTVEVMKKGINKARGIQTYASWNQLSLEEFIAFGDSENDVEMLQKVGLGVCLRDGSAACKKAAQDRTDLTCEEGGVGDYLLKHVI